MTLKQSLIRTFPSAYERITAITGLTPKNRAQGVDVYGKYQGHFRPETATQRIDFAIQKLTEGTTIRDPKMDEIWSGVKQIGMRGAYHYQRSGVSWLAQSNYFLDAASKYDHHFYALDVEKINNTLNDAFFADMYRIFNHWVEQAPGKKIVLYSNWDLFKNFIYPRINALYGALGLKWLLETVVVDGSWYAQYWNVPSVDKDPSLPAWMTTWKIWQITDNALKPLSGSDWGMGSEDGDVDVFNGTPDEMRAWLRLAPRPGPDPTPEPTPEPEPEPDPGPIVVEPPSRPEITTEPRLWSAVVIPLRRMLVRSYPITEDDTLIADEEGWVKVYGGEMFRGVLWAGNGYVWMRIEEYPSRPALVGRWVAVRTTDGTEKFIRLETAGAVLAYPQLWQVLHDAQMGIVRRPTDGNGAPEIFPMIEKHFTEFTKPWQEFSFEVMALPPGSWRAVFNWQRVITNEQGFEIPGDPRADYINKRNLGAENPKYSSLLFGGNVITGRVDGNYLWVETLDGTKLPPSVAWVKERPWLVQVCTNVVYATGAVHNFPQGDGLPVIVPILTSKPVKFPLKNLKKLPLGSPIPKVYWP